MRKRWFFIAPAIWVVVLGLLLGLSTLGEQAPYVVLFGLGIVFVGIVVTGLREVRSHRGAARRPPSKRLGYSLLAGAAITALLALQIAAGDSGGIARESRFVLALVLAPPAGVIAGLATWFAVPPLLASQANARPRPSMFASPRPVPQSVGGTILAPPGVVPPVVAGVGVGGIGVAGSTATAPRSAIPDLGPALAELERARQATVAAVGARARVRVPAALAIGLGVFWLTTLSDGSFDWGSLFSFAVVSGAAGYLWASSALADAYRKLYKQKVLPVLAAGFGDLSWRSATPPDLARLREARLLEAYDRAIAEDELFGSHHNLPISITELRLEKGSGKSKSIPFDGLLVRVTLPRGLKGSTAIVASEGVFASLRDWFGSNTRQRVTLEDPGFDAVYQVWSTDQVAARALLTPAFMQRLLALADRPGFNRPLALADDNDLLLAVPRFGGSLFEPPSYRRPAASREALAKLESDIAAVLGVVDAIIDLDYAARAVAGTA